MNRTDELLKKDSIAETERIFGGKDYHEFNDFQNAVMMLNCIRDNQIKTEHLKSINDTYWGIKWNEFKSLLKEYGFEEGLSYKFKDIDEYRTNTEEAIIYYHKEKGLIIWATSYGNMNDINGGTLYGMIKPGKDNEHNSRIINTLNGCSHGCTKYFDRETKEYKNYEAIEFSKDVREGLLHVLNRIESVTEFVNKWTENKPFLWLVDFTEDDEPNYDYKEINKNKINRCTEEVRYIIGEYKTA